MCDNSRWLSVLVYEKIYLPYSQHVAQKTLPLFKTTLVLPMHSLAARQISV